MKQIDWNTVKPNQVTLDDLENSKIIPDTYSNATWRCAQALYKIYKQNNNFFELDLKERRFYEKGFDIENNYDCIMQTTGFMYSWAENALRQYLGMPIIHDRCSYIQTDSGVLLEIEPKFDIDKNPDQAFNEAIR